MFQMYQPSDRFDWLTRICALPLVSPAICLSGPFVRPGSIRGGESVWQHVIDSFCRILLRMNTIIAFLQPPRTVGLRRTLEQPTPKLNLAQRLTRHPNQIDRSQRTPPASAGQKQGTRRKAQPHALVLPCEGRLGSDRRRAV
jgi:hypothetical protein